MALLIRIASATAVMLILRTAIAAGAQTPGAPGTAGAAAHAHRTIATAVPAAQAAFDRGLVMLYAFNIGAARAAFRAAEAADPRAALPYFGEAVSETIDINEPTTADGERRGADAVRRSRAALAAAPPDERALLAAAAARFDLAQPQPKRFTAYFSALQAYARAHPDDGMGLTLAAYAGWNATGLLTDGPDHVLTADAQAMADDLDAALKHDPDDVGAHHLRIHFWEEAGRPERALTDADALSALTFEPGQSHLEHMAGHVYDRLGDYPRMIEANVAACANDDVYFRAGEGDGQTYMRGYHDHDVDFVLYGLTTIGRGAEARAFAAHESAYAREIVDLRLHDGRAVLDRLGAAITPMRVIAEARADDLDAARSDLAALSHGKAAGGGDIDVRIAAAVVGRAAHDAPAAVAAYRAAQAAIGQDLGDPKLHWWTPVGEGLGATLLEAHEPAAAEEVFRSELVRYPNDPHLEFGLAEALAAQKKDDRAARAAVLAGWHGDRPLTVADLG